MGKGLRDLKPPSLPRTPGHQSRRTSIGDADNFRAPLRLSEGVGGDKKYEKVLGASSGSRRVPPPLRALEDGIQFP